MDLFSGAVGALISGAIVYLIQYLVHRREKKHNREEQRTVKFTNEERRITSSIFSFLGPRSSVELMKAELGPPNQKLKESGGLFLDSSKFKQTNSYVYFFKNCEVKITSKDGEVIDSLTVMTKDTDINFGNLFFDEPGEKFLNIQTLTKDMLEESKVEAFQGCMDGYTAVQKIIEMPFYIYLTYFLDHMGDEEVMDKPNLLVGSKIIGICLSSDGEAPSYIFAERPYNYASEA